MYQCWHSFPPTVFLSSSPAFLLETIIAAVDQGQGDTDKWGSMQLCIDSQRLFFKEHLISRVVNHRLFLASCISDEVTEKSKDSNSSYGSLGSSC